MMVTNEWMPMGYRRDVCESCREVQEFYVEWQMAEGEEPKDREFILLRSAKSFAGTILGEVYRRVNLRETENADGVPFWEWDCEEVLL